MACPGKWKHGLKSAVPWWFNWDPYPRHLSFSRMLSFSIVMFSYIASLGNKECRENRQREQSFSHPRLEPKTPNWSQRVFVSGPYSKVLLLAAGPPIQNIKESSNGRINSKLKSNGDSKTHIKRKPQQYQYREKKTQNKSNIAKQ